MAIISRVPGVALLLVGLTLLSGNARAAEPSYDDYVAQVKAGKLDIDYTAFRMAYTASPKYEPYGAARALIGQMKKAYTADDWSGRDGACKGDIRGQPRSDRRPLCIGPLPKEGGQ
jgi:hypothetical protein